MQRGRFGSALDLEVVILVVRSAGSALEAAVFLQANHQGIGGEACRRDLLDGVKHLAHRHVAAHTLAHALDDGFGHGRGTPECFGKDFVFIHDWTVLSLGGFVLNLFMAVVMPAPKKVSIACTAQSSRASSSAVSSR